MKVAGAVQANIGQDKADNGSDMDLRLLPADQVICISQNLGALSEGCRLDSGALEEVAAAVERALDEDADLLIINKYGIRETEGRGFRSAIAKAVEKDIPVLTGLSTSNATDFNTFTGDFSESLPLDIDTVVDWSLKACGK